MASFAGAWPAMITPFNGASQIERGAYRAMVQWYLERGVGGLYANCLSSEMYHLTETERLQLARDAVEAVRGRAPVAATGNFGSSITEHVRACQKMADSGVDVVMLVVPFFLENDAELEAYFMQLAAEVPAALGLYECPVPRSYHLGVELVGKLAQTGRFVAFKETSCDLDKIQRLVAVTQGTSLALLQANTPYLLEAVRCGSAGSMSIAATWLPDLVAAVISAAQTGDPAAERLHAQLCALEMAQRAVHPLGTKYLLSKRGLPIAARLRSTPEPLAAEVRRGLDACAAAWLDEQGNLAEHILGKAGQPGSGSS